MNLNYLDTFFHFQNVLKSVQNHPSFLTLDYIEEKLLIAIAGAKRGGIPVLVGDLLAFTHLASQATLHGRLRALKSKGLIEYQSDLDGRKKYLVPSEKANRYFSMLGECITKLGQ